MKNRVIAALAALALAPAALAQEAAPAAPAAPAPQAAPAPEAPAPEAAPAAPAVDTSKLEAKVAALAEQVAESKKDVSALKKLKISGYVQARYAWQQASANYYNVTTAEGPDQQGFFIRRARFKAVYDADWSQYALQLDATLRGVLAKEAYATLKLPAGLSVDAGLQLIPFGYEVLVRSSSDLDLLERARVTRLYINGEYDLGVAMKGVYGPVNFKVGVFNGNGVAGWGFANASAGRDNDQVKDVIGRVGYDLGFVTGGFSGWYGKAIDYTSLVNGAHPTYDRYRAGADVQVYLDLLPVGGTAVKGEYIWGRSGLGTDAGGGGDTKTLGKTGHGWYALVTQVVGPWNQLAVRYEQFMPNNTASTAGATNTTVKRTDELQAALHTFIGQNYKLSFAYYHPLVGEKGAAAYLDPAVKKNDVDQWIVQAQAKF
jgi:hypothetical protein